MFKEGCPYFYCGSALYLGIWQISKFSSHRLDFVQRNSFRLSKGLLVLKGVPNTRQTTGRRASAWHAMMDTDLYGTIPLHNRSCNVSKIKSGRANKTFLWSMYSKFKDNNLPCAHTSNSYHQHSCLSVDHSVISFPSHTIRVTSLPLNSGFHWIRVFPWTSCFVIKTASLTKTKKGVVRTDLSVQDPQQCLEQHCSRPLVRDMHIEGDSRQCVQDVFRQLWLKRKLVLI